MEIEASAATSAMAKKLWNIVRIALMMMRKGVSKSKMMVELNLLLKRGKLAGKAVAESLLFHSHHHRAGVDLAGIMSCRSGEALSFVSPRDYEFSCSNSPAAFFPHRHHKRRRGHSTAASAVENSGEFSGEISGDVKRMLEAYYYAEPSPLPGFGGAPVRQLRITDSPFIGNEGLGDSLVDVKAEDFINKFYKSLKQQKRMAYLESPYRPVYG